MARCSITPESLPIEYSMTGLRNSAATSRMMPMDSASRRFSCADRALRVAVVLILDRSCGQRHDVQGAAGNEMGVAQAGLAVSSGAPPGANTCPPPPPARPGRPRYPIPWSVRGADTDPPRPRRPGRISATSRPRRARRRSIAPDRFRFRALRGTVTRRRSDRASAPPERGSAHAQPGSFGSVGWWLRCAQPSATLPMKSPDVTGA